MENKEKEFLELVEAHKGIIHKISRMYMDAEDDQQDLTQEIIYQLWKSYDSFQHQSRFSTWMYRVALNTALVFFKKEKRKMAVTDTMPEHIAMEENVTATKELQLAHFYRAVQKLERLEKALVFLHLENYSHKEIGENLGISEGNARIKLSRAKDKLKELIKKQGYEF
ncbi:RNA polymerase sigma-70 factor, ECF subfamily [Chitinophaga ginsengisegetis]|uniref:RNA polymerase sigma-70 factor, ECF subfamily n=1 Tax=Chitinophaga ginsengisegetis TaxID=393003 RepID=A0A1T5P3E7_9BACT|nr:RNA polymerase sigma factor [Chitinophaga ginsengisegetis]SKD06819.1 RNA polymerase sigma-70 factor, ECF subfamily [Chitinophaga ginsengisegetis]